MTQNLDMNNYDIINLRRIQDLSGSVGSVGQVLSSGLNGNVSWVNGSSGGGNVDLSSYATIESVENSLALYAPISGAIFKGDVKFNTLDISSGAKSMSLENIDGTTTFKTDNNGQYPFRFMGQLQNYINNAYENVLTASSLSSYATTSSLSAVASDLSALSSSLSNYAEKTVANTFTLLQTFSSGLTSTGVITANGGITATGQPITCGALSCTTETASGLITANGGLTVPAGQTLNVTGATITGIMKYQHITSTQNITGYAPIMVCSFSTGSYRIKLAPLSNTPVLWYFNNPFSSAITITLERGDSTAVIANIRGKGSQGTTGIITLAGYTNIVGQQFDTNFYYV
jgi:hypothetical protein